MTLAEVQGRPNFASHWVSDFNDWSYKCFWHLHDSVHKWFVEAGIPYKISYEIDWWVEVADEHALLVKLAWGGNVSLN